MAAAAADEEEEEEEEFFVAWRNPMIGPGDKEASGQGKGRCRGRAVNEDATSQYSRGLSLLAGERKEE